MSDATVHVTVDDEVPGGGGVSIIFLFLSLLFLIPPILVVPGLGAAGRPAALIALAMLGLWAMTRCLPQPSNQRTVAIRWAMFAYFVVFMMAYYAGLDRGLPSVELSALDRTFLTMLGLVGIVLVSLDGPRSRVDVERIMTWMVALTCVSCVVAILQFTISLDLASKIQVPGLQPNQDLDELRARGDGAWARVRGLARHPIEFGVIAATMLPIAITVALRRQSRIHWIAVGIIVAAIPLTISRSAVVGLAVGMVALVATWSWRRRGYAAVVGFFALLAFQAAVPGLLGTLRSLLLLGNADPSVAGRTEDYSAVGAFVQDRPWFGRGPGTFIPTRYRYIDNEYLVSLVSTGYLGLAALIGVLLSALLTSHWLVLRSGSEDSRQLAAALRSCILIATVEFATFDALGFAVYSGVLFVCIGLIGAMYRMEPASRTDRPEPHTNALLHVDDRTPSNAS